MGEGWRDGGSVEVLFPVERDVTRWQQRNRAGEVPGLWPYGLDALRDVTSLHVRAAGVRSPRRVERALARVLPTRPWLRRAGRDVALAWDENAAQRMVTIRAHQEMYAGAIWITDAVAAAGGGAATDRRADAVRRTLGRMAGVFVLSRAQVEPLVELLGPAGPPVGWVRFGVDTAFYPYAPYPERPLVVSVGGDRDRDAATLYAALARVHDQVPDAEIVVQTTSELTPPGGVTVARYFTHRQLRELYARAAVVAIATQPNLHASGMTVSLEAMSTGRPVVITGTPGLEDYVAEGVGGHLVPVGDAPSLADRVVDLLRDPGSAEALGRAARTRVEKSLSTRNLVEDLARFMKLPAREASPGSGG